MEKIQATEQIDVLIKELVTTKLLKYTIQFFSKAKDGLKPFGSGVLVQLHNNHFIFTASHVADHLFEDSNNLFIRVAKDKFINVLGDIKSTEIEKSRKVDLAYIKIDPQMLPPLKRSYAFLTIDKVSKHNQKLDGTNYCILGFPEINIKRTDTSFETGAAFYLTSSTNEKPYEHYGFNQEDHFIVNMKGKGTDMSMGGITKVNTHFYGISGGGLWFITPILDPLSKQYTVNYKLIGIMTEFRKGKYFCLIASRIHLMLDALTIMEGFKFKEIRR